MSAPYTFDDLQIDVGDLHALLVAMYGVLHEMPYVRDGKRDEELDQVASLARVARDFSGRISQQVELHHTTIRGGPAHG